MEIAEIAMPDSYFDSDSRVQAARRWIERDDREKAQAASPLDEEGWPKRWSSPTYLGDGPWGA